MKVGLRARHRQIIRAPHRERIEPQLARHLVEQALEREAHVDGAVAAERAAGRRVGEHALADIFDVLEVVDGVEHRAGIEDRHHAIAGMRAAALDAFAFDAGDPAVLLQPDLEPDVGLRPAAMGDEGLLAVDHEPHAALGLARQQRRDQLDVERLGAAAEAAADMRLDHADPRHVHGEDLRQHQVDVVGDLRGGMHRHAVALGVVARDRGVHLHLVLADLGAIVGRLAHEIGVGEGLLDIAELEEHVAFEIAGLLGVQQHGVGRERVGGGEIGRQLLHLHLDERERRLGGGVVDRGDGGDRLAAIAHLVARQRMLGARDRQHAEGLVAIGAGDDRLHAGKLQRLRDVDVDDLGMRIGAAIDAAGQRAGLDRKVGGVFGAAGDLLRAVHHRHVVADVVRGHDLVHGATPLRPSDGRVSHRLDDLHVAGAAADVGAERLADVVIARMRIAAQQADRRHDESRRAIAALRAELFVEAALHCGKPSVVAERFHGVDAPARDARGERQAGEPRLVVDQHRAGAALAAVASRFCAGQADASPANSPAAADCPAPHRRAAGH